MLRILVLGAAAGGGFPQWNCNCPSCARARDGGDSAAPQALQASVAVSADGESWFLLNATPDLRQQINDSSDFEVAWQRVDFYGLCPRCAAAKRRGELSEV